MKHTEMKKKVLALIEELNPKNANLTDDPDIAEKYNSVANQIMYELSRMKKIPRYAETDVEEGDTLDLDGLASVFGNDIYQIISVSGVKYDFKAEGTVIKFLESGTAEIECYVYPPLITEANAKTYIFELSPDVLEIMPYGIAADLLKSDVSAEYGSIYATRYESMLQRLDPRYQSGGITVEGGWDI